MRETLPLPTASPVTAPPLGAFSKSPISSFSSCSISLLPTFLNLLPCRIRSIFICNEYRVNRVHKTNPSQSLVVLIAHPPQPYRVSDPRFFYPPLFLIVSNPSPPDPLFYSGQPFFFSHFCPLRLWPRILLASFSLFPSGCEPRWLSFNCLHP